MAAAAPSPARAHEPLPIGAPSSPPSPLLQVRGLRVLFPLPRRLLQRARAPVAAVDGVSFDIAAGQTLALVGESGCGKTSAGKALMQLLRRNAQVEGEVLLGGRDLLGLQGRALRLARRDIQMIFQDPFSSLNPRMRVQQILEEGVIALRPEWDAAERLSRLQALVEQVGLGRDALERHPHAFSGGQRQRIAIARALAVEPRLIVCDEPTSALDVSVQAQILNLLRRLQREKGIAYLFITHNMGVVEYMADRVAVMRAGRIEEQGSCEQVLARPEANYTKALLAAVPRLMSA
jgi:peptide/nickel transport system ATP-binding protein